ncbi:MAG TPA: dual specificity protein phosphatase [Anaerolineales bacterium]|nr:dual specificity protein phosphatase [Anaerolineales bacterium]
MNYSAITDNLFVGTSPRKADFDILRELGVSLVINMRWMPGPRPARDDAELHYVRFRTFDNPLLPIPLRALIEGVQLALEEIKAGGKVYTHCAAGRHRSVAMAASILIAQGLAPEGAMQLIKQQRPIADPQAFHIRRKIMQFAREWELPG